MAFEGKIGPYKLSVGLEREGEAELDESQLVQIFSDLKGHRKLFDFVVTSIAERDGENYGSPKEIKKMLECISEPTEALGAAKMIERALGTGSMRKISFVSSSADAERNVLKILRRDVRSQDFEYKVEKGMYTGTKESYGVEWDIEKASRDVWQNFFDGQGQTLDGVDIDIDGVGTQKTPEYKATISSEAEYDWRELVHLGGTTKEGDNTTAGGFGEGTQVLSLVLLRDHGAKEVKFRSGDWELEFYIDQIPKASYRREDDQGLYVRKRKIEPIKGNEFEVTFAGESAEDNISAIQDARELFYSSDNPDFHDPVYEKESVGGFKALPLNEEAWVDKTGKGHLYIVGQRTHYKSRTNWDTLEGINIWTRKKYTPKDRDRGHITTDELKEGVMMPIVESMSVDEAKDSIYGFKHAWEHIRHYSANYYLLEMVAEKLEKEGVKLEFEDEYLARDMMPTWVKDLLEKQGYKLCPPFMSKIGMRTVAEQFTDLQTHIRVEETPVERERINLLQRACQEIGLSEGILKDVWIFSGADEKSIFHGQYNDMFFWMAREALDGEFLDALHTYVHEVAHKDGPHGDPKFEYSIDFLKKEVQRFILEHRDSFERLHAEWDAIVSGDN